MGSRLFIHSSPSGKKATEITGLAKRINDDIRDKVFDKFYPNGYIPLIIEKRKTGIGFWAGRFVLLLVISTLIFLIVSGINTINRYKKASLDPHASTQLSKYSEQVIAELKNVIFRYKGLKITKNLLIFDELLKFDIYTIDSLLWIYKRVKESKTLGISTDKEVEIVMLFNNGDIEELKLSRYKEEEITEEIFRIIGSRLPWVLMGYDESISEMSLQMIIRLVEIRKSKFMNMES